MHIFILLEAYLQGEFLELLAALVKTIHRKILFDIAKFLFRIVQSVVPSAIYEHVYFLTALPTECVAIFLKFFQSHQWEMVWMVLICICPILSECENFFYMFQFVLKSFMVSCLFVYFSHFSIGFLVPSPSLQQNHSAIVLSIGCRRILLETGRRLFQ